MKQLLLVYSLVIILMFVFLKGYFPINHKNAPIINPPVEIDGTPLNLDKFYKPQVKKLILVIIDALRYDFISETSMPFLHANMDLLLKVKVEAPTVTLPRIKALTTGAVPQFIDIVLNLGAKAKVADSFLHRAKEHNKRMIFYGDNTWEMMFPELFLRSDGTTSFFVNDFTEVDDNVTRHVEPELRKAEEWDIMILHYLGLDHIGHVRGPFSSLISPKLQEMDDIIKKIITVADTWENETIILITGDHGMKDTGGHGGTTYPETHVPLIIHHNKGNIFTTKAASQQLLQQSDISNTMSALFGIAMPANSIGKVLPQLLTCNKAQLLYTLYYNSLILERNVDYDQKYANKLILAKKLFKQLIKSSNFDSAETDEVILLFRECLEEISNDLIQSSVNQDVVLLVFAIFGTINCFFIVLSPNLFSKQQNYIFISFLVILLGLFVVFHLCNCFYTNIVQLTLLFQMAVFTVFISWKLVRFCVKTKILEVRLVKYVPAFLHGLLLLSSSYIEEEQYIYYYFLCSASVFIAFVCYYKSRHVTMATAMPLTVIEIIRICRGVEALKDWYVKDENLIYLKSIHIIGLIMTYFVVIKLNILKRHQKLTLFIIFISIHIHKFYLERSVTFAQCIWLLITLQLLLSLKFNNLVLILWLSIMTFQLRPYNLILLPAIIICSYIFRKTLLKFKNTDYYLITIHVWLGYAFFFIQGHRNSIADFDLGPSYIGLSSYVPVLVALLSLCHSHAFQTLSLILLFDSCFANKVKEGEVGLWRVVILYKIFIQLVVYFVIFINRGHLFIWSVFAPKLLIECVHTFVLYIQLLVYTLFVGFTGLLKKNK